MYLASSPWFVCLATVFYATMALALWLANIPWWAAIVPTILLFLDYKHVVGMHGLRIHKRSVGVLCQDCDKWQYQTNSGRSYKGMLVKNRSFCSRWLIILYMQHINGGRYIVIPRDALSEHNFRLLAFKCNC